MKEKIDKRFEELIKQGRGLCTFTEDDYYVSKHSTPNYQAWLSSVANLICIISNENNYYNKELNRLITHSDMTNGITTLVLTRTLGLLTSAQTEWSSGLLGEINYIIAAETFDDFLDHAATYHKANKKIEAAVLGSAVFEDTIKKLAQKNGIEIKEKSIDPLIDELTKIGVFTPVKAKRMKAYAGIRNKALHAEWEGFDIKDVGEMISGVRELIEEYL
ncbi:hypothetical protein KJ039_08975 [bacterium]|nr:hypothetical protein [bacterium]